VQNEITSNNSSEARLSGFEPACFYYALICCLSGIAGSMHVTEHVAEGWTVTHPMTRDVLEECGERSIESLICRNCSAPRHAPVQAKLTTNHLYTGDALQEMVVQAVAKTRASMNIPIGKIAKRYRHPLLRLLLASSQF
jgi:hypothetical protein